MPLDFPECAAYPVENGQIEAFMVEKSLKLERLSAAGCADDGRRVGFRIEGGGGDHVDIDCDAADLEGIIRFLVALGGAAAEKRGGVAPQTMGATDLVSISPIGISDLGFMQERGSGDTVLVMRMFGFDLGFQLSPEQLLGLKREFERLMPGAKPDHHHHHHH